MRVCPGTVAVVSVRHRDSRAASSLRGKNQLTRLSPYSPPSCSRLKRDQILTRHVVDGQAKCLTAIVPGSACSVTDVQCICTNSPIQDAAEKCILHGCTSLVDALCKRRCLEKTATLLSHVLTHLAAQRPRTSRPRRATPPFVTGPASTSPCPLPWGQSRCCSS